MIDTIKDALSIALKLMEAYESGRAAGRAEMRQSLLALYWELDRDAKGVSNSDLSSTGLRAPLGSVKPVITRLLKGAYERGLSQDEIATLTQIKMNSVRATLWTMKDEGLIEKRDGRWFPILAQDELVTNECTEPKKEPFSYA